MNTKSLLAVGFFLGAILATRAADTPAMAPASGPYHFIKEIHIGGLPSTDYLTMDSENHRLYVSHGTSVTVVDVDKGEIIGDISGNLTGIHGIAIVNKLGMGYISNGGGNNIAIFDLKTLKITKTVPTGNNPDWIFYEPGQGEVYAFNGRSNTATVINAQTGDVTATITLPGKPESATSDPAAGRVYDNIEDKAEVAVIDTKTHTVVATWPNAPAAGASGQAIDLAKHHLILGCDDTMGLMDSATGKLLSTLKAGAGIDSAAFDPGTGYAFVPCGQAASTTIAKIDGDKLTLVQTLPTATGAKTMALDPVTHNIYMACVKYQAAAPAPAAASASGTGRGGRPPRPAAVADSFRILVYGMDAAPAAAK